jgi:hypothetical protein
MACALLIPLRLADALKPDRKRRAHQYLGVIKLPSLLPQILNLRALESSPSGVASIVQCAMKSGHIAHEGHCLRNGSPFSLVAQVLNHGAARRRRRGSLERRPNANCDRR